MIGLLLPCTLVRNFTAVFQAKKNQGMMCQTKDHARKLTDSKCCLEIWENIF